jgi:hypothetical protein
VKSHPCGNSIVTGGQGGQGTGPKLGVVQFQNESAGPFVAAHQLCEEVCLCAEVVSTHSVSGTQPTLFNPSSKRCPEGNTSSLATSSLPYGMMMHGLMHQQLCVAKTVAYLSGITELRAHKKTETYSACRMHATRCQPVMSSTTQHPYTMEGQTQLTNACHVPTLAVTCMWYVQALSQGCNAATAAGVQHTASRVSCAAADHLARPATAVSSFFCTKC